MMPNCLVHHALPDQHREERRQGVREEQERSVELLAPEIGMVECDGQEEADGEGEDHGSGSKRPVPDEDTEKRAAYGLGREDPTVVVEPDVDLPPRVQAAAVVGSEEPIDGAIDRADRRRW